MEEGGTELEAEAEEGELEGPVRHTCEDVELEEGDTELEEGELAEEGELEGPAEEGSAELEAEAEESELEEGDLVEEGELVGAAELEAEEGELEGPVQHTMDRGRVGGVVCARHTLCNMHILS